MTETQLPDKKSELIRLAIADLEKCEQDPNYTIDMTRWHEPRYDGVCQVCLAGSVMAKTLNANIRFYLDWVRYGSTTSYKLLFLDDIRTYSRIPVEWISYDDRISYFLNPTKFKHNMLVIADRFESSREDSF